MRDRIELALAWVLAALGSLLVAYGLAFFITILSRQQPPWLAWFASLGGYMWAGAPVVVAALILVALGRRGARIVGISTLVYLLAIAALEVRVSGHPAHEPIPGGRSGVALFLLAYVLFPFVACLLGGVAVGVAIRRLRAGAGENTRRAHAARGA